MDSIGTIVDCTLAAFDGIEEVAAATAAARPDSRVRRPRPHRDDAAPLPRLGRAASPTRLVDNYRRLWRAEYKDRVALFPGRSRPSRRCTPPGICSASRRRKGAPDSNGSSTPPACGRSSTPRAPSTRRPRSRRPGCSSDSSRSSASAPAEAVMIGDTSFDLEMAANAGCRGIGVLSGGQRLEHLWRRTVRSPSWRASASCRPGSERRFSPHCSS